MTLNELNKLIKDKNKEIKIFRIDDLLRFLKLPITEVIENDDHIIIGNDLPPELYERDYKYER